MNILLKLHKYILLQRIWYNYTNNGICLVFNATFNNISAISWSSVLMVEQTEVPGENHRPVASCCQT